MDNTGHFKYCSVTKVVWFYVVEPDNSIIENCKNLIEESDDILRVGIGGVQSSSNGEVIISNRWTVSTLVISHSARFLNAWYYWEIWGLTG